MSEPQVPHSLEPDPAYRRNVGIMLLNENGHAWVGRRIDAPQDAWQMPQGGIDPGEDTRQAALRELEEEIGTARAEILLETTGWLTYDIPREIADKLWKGKWRGQAQRWFAMRFTGRDSDISIATAHPEFNAWRWVPRAELPELIVPFKRAVYAAVLAEFEPKLKTLGL
jgi:putative (di)nucleoside polyphosphate hydrolase